MPETPYSADELDALDTLHMVPGYQLLEARMTAEIERRRDELENDKLDAVATAICRGKLLGLRAALSMREIMRDEARAEFKEHARGE